MMLWADQLHAQHRRYMLGIFTWHEGHLVNCMRTTEMPPVSCGQGSIPDVSTCLRPARMNAACLHVLLQ